MNYDDWKLMTPEEDAGLDRIHYCSINAKVLLLDTTDREITINLEVPLVYDEDEDGKHCYPEDVLQAVKEYVFDNYKGYDFELLDWNQV